MRLLLLLFNWLIEGKEGEEDGETEESESLRISSTVR